MFKLDMVWNNKNGQIWILKLSIQYSLKYCGVKRTLFIVEFSKHNSPLGVFSLPTGLPKSLTFGYFLEDGSGFHF